MTNDIRVKICGLTQPAHVAAAISAGAGYLGFVFFEKSPRNVSAAQAGVLARDVPPGIAKVALTVNGDDGELDEIVTTMAPDMLQLHGGESPDRVAEVRTRYGLPVIKAVGVAGEQDLPALLEYGRVADQILVDAKPPKGADLPGGNGLSFDWRLISGRRWPVPWMLAGGLHGGNVAEAIRLTGARQVDVSSGVESAPGVKDERKIADFIIAAQGEQR